MTDEEALARLKTLAGIKPEDAIKITNAGQATIFDAGSVPEMKRVLDGYKAASRDQTPSHVFVLGDQVWIATAVVGVDRTPEKK